MQELAAARHLSVAFTGERDRTGPLTVGQRNVLQWVTDPADPSSAVIPFVVAVPTAAGADAVAQAVATLVGRHESLRTAFLTGDGGQPLQRVVRSGVLVVEVYELVGDDAEFVPALEARLAATPIDLATGSPLRVAIVTCRGAAVCVVLVVSHLAVDGGSIVVLTRELTALLAPAPRPDLPTPGRQPLDQAGVEGSASGVRRGRAALEHWTTILSTAPLRLPLPRRSTAAAPMCASFVSPAAAAALTRIVAYTRASPSTVVLTAVSAVLGRWVDSPTCLVVSISSNRFQPALRDYVGPLAQDALISYDLAAPTFAALVGRAWAAQLAGYRHSQFDAVELGHRMAGVLAHRGMGFGRDWVFNDVGAIREADRVAAPAALAEIDAALPGTRLTWVDGQPVPVLLFFRLLRVRGELRLDVYADARHAATGEVEALLYGVERLLVAAAAAADVPLAALDKITGVRPAARDGGWVRLDVGWVELAACDALLRVAADGRPGAAFVGATDELVGYVGDADGLRLDAVHRECLARVADRPTAVAPTRYVLCAGRPADASPAAWAALPVLAEGTGRG